MHPGGLVGDRPEDHHLPVVEQAVAVAVDRVLDLLADQVVGEEHVVPVRAPQEDIEHVLTVGRLYYLLVLQICGVALEDLALARL